MQRTALQEIAALPATDPLRAPLMEVCARNFTAVSFASEDTMDPENLDVLREIVELRERELAEQARRDGRNEGLRDGRNEGRADGLATASVEAAPKAYARRFGLHSLRAGYLPALRSFRRSTSVTP